MNDKIEKETVSKVSSSDLENSKKVLWAIGGKYSKNTIHAYMTKEAYEAGNCLCGRHVNPNIEMINLDLNDKDVQEHLCKECRERLKLLNYMKSSGWVK